MVRYAIRRILLLIPTLLIASLLVAGMVRVLPGDVIQSLVGGMGGTGRIRNEEAKDMVRVRLGLDQPFYKQYLTWVFGWTKTEGAVFKTSDGGATWRKLGSQTVRPVSQVTFITPTVGWSLAEEMIYGTDDGARLWARQYGADYPLHGLSSPMRIMAGQWGIMEPFSTLPKVVMLTSMKMASGPSPGLPRIAAPSNTFLM